MKKKYEINGRIETLKTGAEWASLLNISIVNPTGWDSAERFYDKNISKAEFLNRASNSVLIPSKNVSRREALKMKKTLGEN